MALLLGESSLCFLVAQNAPHMKELALVIISVKPAIQ
jgi:hypothetical protein